MASVWATEACLGYLPTTLFHRFPTDHLRSAYQMHHTDCPAAAEAAWCKDLLKLRGATSSQILALTQLHENNASMHICSPDHLSIR